MDSDRSRLLGIIGALAGVLLVVGALPPGWYGVSNLPPSVSDPAPWSPRWLHQNVMPALSVLGVLGLFFGLLGLLRRDWSSADRMRRWSGIAALFGLGGLAITTPFLAFVNFADSGADSPTAIVGVVLGGLSVLVLTISLVFLGVAYLRTTRPVLGYALGGIVVVLPLVVSIAPDSMATFAASLPVALVAAIVGHDLYHRPEPVSRYVPDETE